MTAIAVFTSKRNSHPFQDRHVNLKEAVKIGRSVARARPAPNNAIFDCKVLSRNHALLWYEAGKFFLQDTKSSNGTFVNNERLSKGSEESKPREIFSGYTVQFGVDVMENSRKVTHGCIISSIQLYHPDGQETIRGPLSPFLTGMGGTGAALQSQELYQLAQYLQEALHREQMLENKLATLQRLVATTHEASETGWQALIDEDRLLSRLEVLENQLQTYSKNQTEDTLRQELTALQEDKYNYETTAKESLRKMLQEKLDAVRKLSELERSLSNTEDECSHLKDMCDLSQKELQLLAEKHEEQLKEMQTLQEQLVEAETKHQEEYEKVEKEKMELEAKLEEMVREENALSAKVEALQADNDFTKEQLTNMKTKMEAIKEKDGDNRDIPEFESTGVQAELVNLLDLQVLQKINSNTGDGGEDLDLRESSTSGSMSTTITLTESFLRPKNGSTADRNANNSLNVGQGVANDTLQHIQPQNMAVNNLSQEDNATKKLDSDAVVLEPEESSALSEALNLIDSLPCGSSDSDSDDDCTTTIEGDLSSSKPPAQSNDAMGSALKAAFSLIDNLPCENSDSDNEDSDNDVNIANLDHQNVNMNHSNAKADPAMGSALNDALSLIDNLKEDSDSDDDDECEYSSTETQSKEQLREKLLQTQQQIENYKAQLKESESRLKESKEAVQTLQNQLENAQLECVTHLARITTLEERLNQSDAQLYQVADNAIVDLKLQLSESRKQGDNSEKLACKLKDHVGILQQELQAHKVEADLRNRLLPDATDITNSNSIPNHLNTSKGTIHLKEEIDRLEELLQEARDSQKKSDAEVERCKNELEEAASRASKSSEDVTLLHKQLAETQGKTREKCEQNSKLQDQLNMAESSTKDVKQQILVLRDRLLEEQEAARIKQEDVDKLRSELVWRIPVGVQLVWHG